MSDTPTKVVSAVPMAITAAGSATVGDQAGDSIAVILTWLTQLACKCEIPVTVTNAYHTLCVLAIVTGAMLVHIKFAKPQGD